MMYSKHILLECAQYFFVTQAKSHDVEIHEIQRGKFTEGTVVMVKNLLLPRKTIEFDHWKTRELNKKQKVSDKNLSVLETWWQNNFQMESVRL